MKVDQEVLEKFLDSSVDGYWDGTEQELVFHVRAPTSHWVRRNLLPGMRAEEMAGGDLRVIARGAAPVVARFIAGLGGDAVAEAEGLRALVRDVAEGALEAHREKKL